MKAPRPIASSKCVCGFAGYLLWGLLFFLLRLPQLLNDGSVPGTSLGPEYTAVNKTNKNSCPYRADTEVGKTADNHTNI